MQQLVLDKSPIILCVNETHVTNDFKDSELRINGYNHYIAYTESCHTGGTIIYVRNHISCTLVKNVVCHGHFWFLCLDVQLKSEHIIVGALYRSPNGSVDLFFQFLEELLEDDVITTHQSIFLGDFNIRLESENANKNKLINITSDSGFTQIVQECTRVTNSSATLIDLILTNNYSLKEATGDFPQISDHRIIGCLLQVENDVKKSEIRYKRKLNTENMNSIVAELYSVDWDYSSTDVDVLYENFMTNITRTVNMVAPLEKIETHKRPWINGLVIRARRDRDEAYKKFKITKLNTDWNVYKKKRNLYVRVIRKEKKKYYEITIDQCKGDSKKMWRTLKEVVGSKNKNILSYDNVKFDEDKGGIQENFNNFYLKSINEIADSIPRVAPKFQELHQVNGILSNFNTISIEKLKETVMKLKNKSTADDICNVKFLKSAFCVLGYPLLHLINTSLTTGKVPKQLKTSVIVPIPKVPEPNKPDEYRPINLLSVIDKILEAVVCSQLRQFLEGNNLLFKGQSGFREKHSCESALQYVCSKWRSNIHDGDVVLSVFIDLQRAFETIDRKRLVQKLQTCGITNSALVWFADYLENRSHVTRVNNVTSNPVNSEIGVPQGSVLGPLLFVLYVNDLNRVLDNTFLSLFADDTLICVNGKDFNQIVDTINSKLDILYNWLCVNRLSLNVKKTKYMVFGSKQNCNRFLENNYSIKIDDVPIESTSNMKYLGVILDSQLNFSLHVDHISKKIGKKIGFFRRIAENLSHWSRLLVYNTIIYPHFNYCFSLLISCKKADIQRLQLLQNKAMRTVLFCTRYTPINLMLNTLGWLSIQQSVEMSNVLLVFKTKNQLLPEYLQEYLVPRSERHSHNIRSRDAFDIDFARTTHMQKCLFGDGLRLFNALPVEVRNATSVKMFIGRVKKLYLDRT